MKISELIVHLQKSLKAWGDLDVKTFGEGPYATVSSGSLNAISGCIDGLLLEHKDDFRTDQVFIGYEDTSNLREGFNATVARDITNSILAKQKEEDLETILRHIELCCQQGSSEGTVSDVPDSTLEYVSRELEKRGFVVTAENQIITIKW